MQSMILLETKRQKLPKLSNNSKTVFFNWDHFRVGVLRWREVCQFPFRRILTPWISPLDMILGATEVCLLLCYYFVWLSRNNNMRRPGFELLTVNWLSALEPNRPRGRPIVWKMYQSDLKFSSKLLQLSNKFHKIQNYFKKSNLL